MANIGPLARSILCLSLFMDCCVKSSWQPSELHILIMSLGLMGNWGTEYLNHFPKVTVSVWWSQDLNSGSLIFPFSVGKESTCNAGDTSLIPGLGRSTREEIGYPLQYSWASLVAQLVKNPPATWETWVRSLGWEDPLEKGKATHSNILARRIPWSV